MDARKVVGDYANVSGLLLNVHHSAIAMGTASTMITIRYGIMMIHISVVCILHIVTKSQMVAILSFNMNLASILFYMHFIN